MPNQIPQVEQHPLQGLQGKQIKVQWVVGSEGQEVTQVVFLGAAPGFLIVRKIDNTVMFIKMDAITVIEECKLQVMNNPGIVLG